MRKLLSPDELRNLRQCLNCGYCREACSTFTSKNESWNARGRMMILEALENGVKPDSAIFERLYGCTLCKACVEACPSGVNVSDLILKFRQKYSKNLGPQIVEPITGMLCRIRNSGNVFGEMEKKLAGRVKPGADAIYFAGCMDMFKYSDRASKTMEILDLCKVDFTTMDETCCGGVLQTYGFQEEFEEVAKRCVKSIKALEVNTLVTGCPNCYLVFNELYPKSVGKLDFNVFHISEIMLNSGILSDLKSQNIKATYFDPCHLGRHSKIYEAPREVLKAILDLELVEMDRNREKSRCCGGPIRSILPELSSGMSEGILMAAKKAGAEVVITSCPTCYNNLKFEEDIVGIKVVDLVDFVFESLKNGKSRI